jgi:hypothetical protein
MSRYIIFFLFTLSLYARVDYFVDADVLTIECSKDECSEYKSFVHNDKLVIQLPKLKRKGYQEVFLHGFKITQGFHKENGGFNQISIDKKDIKKYYIKRVDNKIAIFKRFYFTHIPSDKIQKMQRYSLSRECRVDISSLRYILVPYVDFGGDVSLGEMVVHKSVAKEVSEILYGIYLAKFPIKRMRIIESFRSDVSFSKRANNSVGFYCSNEPRDALHAKGMAIDINPMQNPYLAPGVIKPVGSKEYKKRRIKKPGMLSSDSIPVKLFKYYGWHWTPESSVKYKDFQHFEKR